MPSFSKILSEGDIKRQMAVNSDFVDHLPEHRGGETVNFPVVDVRSGTTWQFGYYVRRDGHPKPVFLGGWHDYRRHRGLKVGDKITFWADGGNYSVQAERKVSLMGREIWTSDF
ncbi:hypothetical protein SLEP1_g10818 [Rubroshorea leprosula]|uniref:TF-B3 domain-containing protein n=1 Tax=Rubroshorea leprosula TaxID=152421 RepID=A0AAV5IHT1_9ROSI|nr:hypothetical protein SLEP1_g10818 [Rubroshorea leprosula]